MACILAESLTSAFFHILFDISLSAAWRTFLRVRVYCSRFQLNYFIITLLPLKRRAMLAGKWSPHYRRCLDFHWTLFRGRSLAFQYYVSILLAIFLAMKQYEKRGSSFFSTTNLVRWLLFSSFFFVHDVKRASAEAGRNNVSVCPWSSTGFTKATTFFFLLQLWPGPWSSGRESLGAGCSIRDRCAGARDESWRSGTSDFACGVKKTFDSLAECAFPWLPATRVKNAITSRQAMVWS